MKKDSKESSNISFIRDLITVVVITLIVGLGYPLFLYTTSIYRADLPVNEVNNFDIESISYKIPIYSNEPLDYNAIESGFRAKYPELVKEWQIEIVDRPEQAKYQIHLEESTGQDSFETNERDIVIKAQSQNNYNSYVQEVLFDNVFKDELETLKALKTDQYSLGVAFPYSPHYNLVFSLFTENGKNINWEIEEALNHFQSVSAFLKNITTFTINTQIQYYTKLSKHYENNYILESDLKTFINFNDWNLVNFDINPTINFLVYIPDNQLSIENSKTNSFLISQWGGIKLFNKNMPMMSNSKLLKEDLIPIMNIFTNQLFKLVGLPEGSQSLQIKLDSLERILIYKNIKNSLNNLKSLIKLSKSLNEITVPEETKQEILKCLENIKLAIENKSVEFSALAEQASNKAFFEKEMVQQAYFPSEHKLAVFLPLLGPIGSIVIFSVIRFIKKFKSTGVVGI
ncbi:GPI17 [Candida jiufengensis]|uniref:GPI17 n=1 Tax=Candida jiufengensis TaxID=497108 RepID=UPI0022249F93|nr:GPI17 [Candida jiufengensis]KAI5956358.1 GPI17 [Candida jiufengensis]